MVVNSFDGGRAMAATATVDRLGAVAADVAMRSAIEFLRDRGFNFQTADLDRLVAVMKRHAVAALEPALADAKAALDANLGRVAEVTFLATMKLAGAAAGREILGEEVR